MKGLVNERLEESKGTGQAWMLQFAVVLPTHVVPPFSGAGLEHVRDIDPVPQVLEHAPYTDHPPLTGAGTGSGTENERSPPPHAQQTFVATGFSQRVP